MTKTNWPKLKALPTMIIKHTDNQGNVKEGQWVKVRPLQKFNDDTSKWENFGWVPEIDNVLEMVKVPADATEPPDASEYDHSFVAYDPSDFVRYRYYYKETSEPVYKDI